MAGSEHMKRARQQRGFTLVEVMVAVAIAAITMGAVFAFFVAQDKIARSQQELGEAQGNARVATEFLARDLRSAGFGIPNPGTAIRIEQACGKNPYTPAGWNDQCPNGSDRVTVHLRDANSFMFGCDNKAVCPASNNGNHLGFLEPNLICSDDGSGGASSTCGPSTHPNGLQCGDTFLPGEKSVSICDPDGAPCVILDVSNVDCNTPCGGGPNPTGCTRVYFHPCSPSCPLGFPALPPLLNAFRESGLGADTFRVYQLLDIDSDGSTELVFSDVAQFASNLTPADMPDKYVVLAPYIDDFQVAVNANNGPNSPALVPSATPDLAPETCGGNDTSCDTFWTNRNIMWSREDTDFDGKTTLADYTNPAGWNAGKFYNGNTAFNACNPFSPTPVEESSDEAGGDAVGCAATLRALRFTVVARAPHRVVDSNGETMFPSRPYPIEDNLQAALMGPTPPPAVPVSSGDPQPDGCGLTPNDQTFSFCTLSGNEPGYARRILTTTINMRNMQGMRQGP